MKWYSTNKNRNLKNGGNMYMGESFNFYKDDIQGVLQEDLGRCILRKKIFEEIFCMFKNGWHEKIEWECVTDAIQSFGGKIIRICVERFKEKEKEKEKKREIYLDQNSDFERWVIGDGEFNIYVFGDMCVEYTKSETECSGKIVVYSVTSFVKRNRNSSLFKKEGPSDDFIKILIKDIKDCLPKNLNF